MSLVFWKNTTLDENAKRSEIKSFIAVRDQQLSQILSPIQLDKISDPTERKKNIRRNKLVSSELGISEQKALYVNEIHSKYKDSVSFILSEETLSQKDKSSMINALTNTKNNQLKNILSTLSIGKNSSGIW